MKNIFTAEVAAEIIQRIKHLQPNTPAIWGKMNVSTMLAHCNITYEMVYEPEKHPQPNGFVKFMLTLLVKPMVVSEKPYKKNSQTAPAFLIKTEKDFATEQHRLLAYIERTQQLGADHFDGKAAHSFGPLTKVEWNNLFYKHLDHHLTQFGV